MTRPLTHLFLVTGGALLAVACVAAPPPPATIETAAAATLGSAQAEQSRLMAWHKAAATFLPEETKRTETLHAGMVRLQTLRTTLMQADVRAWEKARADWNPADLNKQLADWEAALPQSARTNLIAPDDSRALKASLAKARKGLANVERALPTRPAANDWDKQRGRLFSALQAQQDALGPVLRDSEIMTLGLRNQYEDAAGRLTSLERLIALLSPAQRPRKPNEAGGNP